MRRFVRWLRLFLSGISSGLFLACTLFICSASAANPAIVIESIDVDRTAEGSLIHIRSKPVFAFVTYTLKDPDRLIVDPVETDVQSSLTQATLSGTGLVRRWRIFRKDAADPASAVDYISFELTQAAEHLVDPAAEMVVLRLRPKGAASLTREPIRQSSQTPPLPLPSPAEEKESPGQPWTLEGILDFGLSRHRPVQIAQQEIELAQMKVREARRALYPAATIRTSWTDGTASGVGFSEVSSGVQLEQPLYYSGRLMETYRQSLVNLQVAEKRQSKVKADAALEIAQSYFQLIGARMSLIAQEGLLEQTEEILQKSRKRFDQGLLTRLEMLNVEAQANQGKFQRLTAENDLTLAQIKFFQRLRLGPDAVVEVPDQFPSETQVRPIDLEDAMRLSAQYRPDIQVNSLLVEFQEYEERIAKEKGKLKVDLSGFIGASGAAFQTETLNLKKDYFVGLKATQSFGPNSATASATKTQTSPRLGQTTVTDSTVYSGEIGILSQLQGLSEAQQARIGLEKARNDLEETQATVYQEVQEAFISYTKARLQLEYAQQKIKFREEQAKILQAQASLNEALPSQVLEAILKLTDEKVAEVQALTNYYVAVAKLNKAIGLPGYYR